MFWRSVYALCDICRSNPTGGEEKLISFTLHLREFAAGGVVRKLWLELASHHYQEEIGLRIEDNAVNMFSNIMSGLLLILPNVSKRCIRVAGTAS